MTERSLWLLIDDCRDLQADVIARDAAAGKEMLRHCRWAGLLLDHDLGDGESGYDVLVWALEAGALPPVVQLVTSNPVGRNRMRAALTNAGWTQTPQGINAFCRQDSCHDAQRPG